MLFQLFILNIFINQLFALCDTNHEFVCHIDETCIPKTKVCNFISDCLDGEDELRCGACEFDQPPERCGLEFSPDRIFGWYRKQSTAVRDTSYESRLSEETGEPAYQMHLRLNQSMKHSAYLHNNNHDLIYRPMVLFPELRPTDNPKCRFSMQLRFKKQFPDPYKESPLEFNRPTVNLDIIQLKHTSGEPRQKFNDREHKIVNLKGEQSQLEDSWLLHELPIGVRSSVWTLELLIEIKMRSYLPQLSNFKYTDCEPSNGDLSPEEPIEEQTGCLDGQFKCHLSGLCIDMSLVCDFGFDCGQEDTSDEQYCDDYPGRCDFEQESRCDWLSVPSSDSWLWVSAHEKDREEYKQTLRPPVDHTIQSAQIGGHFMLLNLNKEQKEFKMIGPAVHLQQGARDCSMRFWLSGLHISGKLPSLHVGEQNIATETLFKVTSKSRQDYWKRYELSLLNRSNYETRYLTVEIGFILDDQFSGFLALDDVSFTPGCSLSVLGEPVEDVCGENQFYCGLPTRVTNAYCIPVEYYCDFKNDCGVASQQETAISSDEIDCPHVCLFKESGLECNFNIIDAAYLNNAGELDGGKRVNEAFEWQASETGLTVESRVVDFIGDFEGQLECVNPDRCSRSVSKEHLERPTINLRDFRVELPRFSESHGNCQFEFTYGWSSNAQHLIASIFISGEHIASEILLKRILPGDENESSRQTINVGVGQQNATFKLIFELSFDGDPHYMATKKAEGSFNIYSYQFKRCNFVEGLVDTTNQVQFEEFVDDEGELEFPPPINKSCETGFFQCNNPIVCLPEHLVCDMQRDCQGGADELDCDDNLRYNFDEEHNLAGWMAQQSEDPSRPVKWKLISGSQLNAYWRGVLDSGPPFDHTRADDQGGFLLLTGADYNWPTTLSADIISPRFKGFKDEASMSCRLVFYLYLWGEDVNQLQVLRRSFSTETSKDVKLYERSGVDEQFDFWQRVEIVLEPLVDELEFAIVLRATKSSGWSDLIAIDDVSLSHPCGLSKISSAKLPGVIGQHEDVPVVIIDGNEPSSHWNVLIIIMCVLIAISLLLVIVLFKSNGGGGSGSGVSRQLANRLALLRSALITRDESGNGERNEMRIDQSYSMEVLANDRVFLVETDSLQQQRQQVVAMEQNE